MEELNLEDARKKALLATLRRTADSISAEDHPEGATPEKVAAWVREMRRDRPHPETGGQPEEQ